MKRFFLPVLSWALAISPIIAQNTLPPSIQPYAVNWSFSVKQMLESAGIEVPGPHAEFELTTPIQTRSSDVVLDSTVSYNGYVSTQDSLPLLRNVYTYPQPGKQVIVESFYNNDHWEAMTRTTLIADEMGRMVETYAELFDAASGTYTPDSRIELHPHGTSDELIDSFFVFGWSVELQDWVRLLAVWNSYDHNQLTESTSSVEIFDVPLVFIDRYAYNTEGDNIRIESFTVIEQEEILAGRQELWYEDHLLTSVTTLVSEGPNGLITESKIDYSYTLNRQVEWVQSFVYDLEKQDWRLTRSEGYFYDDEMRVTAEEIFTDESGLWVRSLTTWAYHSEDFPSVESRFSFDDNAGTWVVDDKKYYYYDDLTAVDPDPIVADALFLYPNPSAGMVQIKLPGKVSVHVYTLAGQFVQKFYMAPGEKMLDLSFLSAGIYQVMAKSDEDYFSGKLIIQ